MSGLTPSHHTLIQALLSRGPLKEDKFHNVFKDITGKNPGTYQQLFDDYLLKINKALSYVQFELRGCRYQYDGQVYYGVVNNVSDEQSKLGTKYSVPQIAFYKAVIEAIVQDATANGSISTINALNLRLENQVTGTGSQAQDGHIPALKNFTLSQREKTLNELVQDQWLSVTPDDNVGLGMRSFLDLRSWFRSNDVPSCDVCNEAGVKAELCQNEACAVRIHLYCLKKMFSQRRVSRDAFFFVFDSLKSFTHCDEFQGGRVCPSCGTQWQCKLPKEEPVEEDDEPDEPTQSTAPPERTGKRLRSNSTGESNSSKATQPSSDLRRATRSSSHAR